MTGRSVRIAYSSSSLGVSVIGSSYRSTVMNDELDCGRLRQCVSLSTEPLAPGSGALSAVTVNLCCSTARKHQSPGNPL